MDENQKKVKNNNFRGLTVFELLLIVSVVLCSILWALSTRASMQNKVYDEQRIARVTALKENLMILVDRNGTFPNDEQFQNEEKRKELFNQYLSENGQDFLSDPKDKQKLISYIAEPEECAATFEDPCTKVTIALELSNGDQFIKFGIQPGREGEYLKQASEELKQNQDILEN
ncbi:MAG: hypothetical protein H6799_02460 [Candidatus Nomurabacteria bacterium]|nr:MAG: hypothetical protein H6799_02460 [Candidatus Nomurabacteria bacterium]HRV75845.1 hypothetical protein [Candidatus Saccharimonadales bacterium]